jgi:ribosomal protein S27E
MVQCPICRSDQIVFIVGPRRTSCFNCRVSWIQDDGKQTAVHRYESPTPPPPASECGAAS